jgi:hypothetical protein
MTIDSKNLEGMRVIPLDPESGALEVVEWHELPDGQGKPSQVHIAVTLDADLPKFAIRLKSREAVEHLVGILLEHAAAVWPKAAPSPGSPGASAPKTRRTIDPHIETLCRRISADLADALPEGMGFGLYLSATKAPGSGGEALVFGSNIPRDEGVAAMYHWIETLGERGTGIALAPMLHLAIALLRATQGRGLSAGAITPARAFAIGAMAGIGFAGMNECSEEELATEAIALLELMIQAEPVAEAELATERAARRS